VFSADAWARLCAVQGKRRVAPLRVLIGQRFDTRAALCAALCAHGATVAALDDAFWRLADRGYARFLEAFDWVLAYRQHLPEWTQTMAVAKTVQSVLKTQGLSRTIPAAVRAELIAHAPLAAPVADFRARLLEHVDREAAKLPAEVTWLASSDIIESVFGQYKSFAARSPLKEVGRLVLLIPPFFGLERPGHPRCAGISAHPGCRAVGRAAARDFHARTPSACPEARHQNCMNTAGLCGGGLNSLARTWSRHQPDLSKVHHRTSVICAHPP
jgi:hypothetical protein